MTKQQTFAFNWQGIHHIALLTEDLDATRHFYKEVLGMHLGPIAPSTQGRGRHCVILVKPNDDNMLGFHFFERPNASSPSHLVGEGNVPSLVPHIALRLSDEAEATALRERLNQARVEITEIPQLGSFLIVDNNHLCLEITWPRAKSAS